ncbi:MAG: ATP-binding cassette domain-containing protein [Bacteroidia bacterium]|nr:ATP-binding cassette domain-containing protein [Bacteroidia bacterium]MBP6658130.1 ATP-binding cassette domain-containing protein [Bacteroidia bacterium]
MSCIELKEVSHCFRGNEPVLRKINLMVPKGSIYGFLGPNGAGKTTTLRLILGLLKRQTGSINVFNVPFDENRIEILNQTGSLIESPSLYSHLTAYENLNVLRKIYQCPESRINDVLELVGLSNTGKKKSGLFSLGMKQRLGIAIALLNNPALLILDEPTNGLDPNGILEIRELLKRINAESGIAIVISSHLLSEIEKLVSHVGIINNGAMLFQGTLSDLKRQKLQASGVLFKTNDAIRSQMILKENGIDTQISDDSLIIPAFEPKQISLLNRKLMEDGIEVHEISPINNDLEKIFMNLVSN